MIKNFSFVIPGVIAGSAWPKGDPAEVVAELRKVGIKTVVNLTEFSHPAADAMRGAGMNAHHIPVFDFSPPTVQQMEEVGEIVLKEENRPVLFHCAMGVGRTGIMLAAAVAALRHSKDPCTASHDLSEHPHAFVRCVRPGTATLRMQVCALDEFIAGHHRKASAL